MWDGCGDGCRVGIGGVFRQHNQSVPDGKTKQEKRLLLQLRSKETDQTAAGGRGGLWGMGYLHHRRMVKRHFQRVAASVVSIGDLGDGLAACVCKRKQKFFPVQVDGSQSDVFWELAEVGGEGPLLHHGAWSSSLLEDAFREAGERVGLTVLCEDGTRNHGRHGSVKPEPGLHLILVHQDLFKVEMEGVEVEEEAVHKGLQQIRRSSTTAALLSIYTKKNKVSTRPSCVPHQHPRERRSGTWSGVSGLCSPSFLQLAAPEVPRSGQG